MNKLNKIFRWFDKEDIPQTCYSKTFNNNNDFKKFYLFLDGLKVGELSYNDNQWCFKYSEEFINDIEYFNLIVGFPDLHKTYCSDELWPFFKVRIPGLKQPRVKEIISKENIDINSDVKLLERFGKRTISNPFELEACI